MHFAMAHMPRMPCPLAICKNQKRKLNMLCKSILTSRCTLRKPNTSMFANSQKRSKFKQYITINLKKNY